MSTSAPNFFQTIEDEAVKIVDDLLGKAAPEIKSIESNISKFGNVVVNEYKKLAANSEVALAAEWFVGIAEGIDPALTPLISGIELEFPKIVNIATGVLGEVAKPLGQQLGDGLTAIAATKAANSVLGSNILGGLNAAIQNYVITNNATTVLPASDAQLITAAQVVHLQAS